LAISVSILAGVHRVPRSTALIKLPRLSIFMSASKGVGDPLRRLLHDKKKAFVEASVRALLFESGVGFCQVRLSRSRAFLFHSEQARKAEQEGSCWLSTFISGK
jgi:hypothetical protein